MSAGESHGPALVGIISGFPSGMEISFDALGREVSRRQKGIGRSERQKIETDTVKFLAGIRHGLTIGSPIAVTIENLDHANWRDMMSAESNGEHEKALPRPGHADLAGMLKHGFDDARNVLERASARNTAITVTFGALARQYLANFDTHVGSRLIAYGSEWLVEENLVPPTRSDIGDDPSVVKSFSELDEDQLSRIETLVNQARESGETLGGVIQIIAAHVPPGLGSYALPDERLDSRLASAALGVPGIKATEIGAGIDQAYMTGKEAHDQYAIGEENPHHDKWYSRSSNHAGGIEGGVTNGEPVCLTTWMKPISTVKPPNMSIDVTSRKPVMPDRVERGDVAAVESAACVLEAVVALELAKAHLEKFAGNSMSEVRRAYEGYLQSIDK